MTDQPDPSTPDTGRESAPQRGSWGPVVAVTVASCLAAAGVLWVVVPKGGTASAPGAQELAAGRPERQAAPTHASQAARQPKAKPPYSGPPKFTVQLGDTLASDCKPTFNESVVVRVIKGEADTITAVTKIPVMKLNRSRELYHLDSEWTTMLSSLPTAKTVQLLVIAKGPGGSTTIANDISHECSGKPMDQKSLFGTEQGRQQMRQMFQDHYDFDFDGSGSKDGTDSKEGADSKDASEPAASPAAEPTTTAPEPTRTRTTDAG